MEFASGLEHALAIKVYFKLQVFFQIWLTLKHPDLALCLTQVFN